MADGKDRIIYYGEGRRDLMSRFIENNIFGLSTSIENKNQAFFVASWGLQSPEPVKKLDRSGWTRAVYLKDAEDKALVSIPLLGTIKTDKELDEFSKLDTCIDHFEKCIEKGFQELEKKIESARWDNVLLEQRVLHDLDLLYTQYFEDDIK